MLHENNDNSRAAVVAVITIILGSVFRDTSSAVAITGGCSKVHIQHFACSSPTS